MKNTISSKIPKETKKRPKKDKKNTKKYKKRPCVHAILERDGKIVE